MASGSISGSIKNGAYTVRIDWATVDNVANNTSQVVATMYLVQASTASLDIWSRECAIWIDGTKYTFNSPYEISNGGGCTTTLGQVTSNSIAHNADGSKSVKLSGVFNIQATISGTYYNAINVPEQTIGLTTLPRATTPTLSASSVDMGGRITINTPRASSAFTHNLDYSFAGGSYVRFATGVGTSYTWTVPDLASSIPNGVSGLITVRCTTMNGSTAIGSKTVGFTARVPSSVVPTISSVSLTEAVSGLAAQFGAFIQGKSRIRASISASGAKGSSITSYSTTFAGGSYSGSSWTTGYIGSSGTLRAVTTVVDSRGRIAKQTTDVTVLAYSPPTISRFSAYRCLQDGTANDDGEYIIATYAYKVLSLNGGNTASVVIQKKKSSESSWANVHTLSGLEASGSVQLSDFSIDYQWDVRLMVTDYFGTPVSYAALVPSDDVIMDINAEGKGLSIGKTSEANNFDVGWDTVLSNLHVKEYEKVDKFDIEDDPDGEKLYSTLDSILATMGNRTIKRVSISDYPYISGSYFYGKIMKHSADWAIVTLEGYESYYRRITIVKFAGVWQSPKSTYGEGIARFGFYGGWMGMFPSPADAAQNKNRKGWIGYDNGDVLHFIDEGSGGIYHSTTGPHVWIIRGSSTTYGMELYYNSLRPNNSAKNNMYLGISNSRWLQLYAVNGTINTSDRNLKTDIQPINKKYIDLFDRLLPVTFKLAGGNHDRIHVGFIAQDVEAAMDEVGITPEEFAAYCRDTKKETVEVKDPETGEKKPQDRDVLDEDGNPIYLYSLRYTEFIALNTRMIQENRKKIASIEKENAELKARLEKIEAALGL